MSFAGDITDFDSDADASALKRTQPNTAFLARYLHGVQRGNVRILETNASKAAQQAMAASASAAFRPKLLKAAGSRAPVESLHKVCMGSAEEQKLALCSALMREVAQVFGYTLSVAVSNGADQQQQQLEQDRDATAGDGTRMFATLQRGGANNADGDGAAAAAAGYSLPNGHDSPVPCAAGADREADVDTDRLSMSMEQDYPEPDPATDESHQQATLSSRDRYMPQPQPYQDVADARPYDKRYDEDLPPSTDPAWRREPQPYQAYEPEHGDNPAEPPSWQQHQQPVEYEPYHRGEAAAHPEQRQQQRQQLGSEQATWSEIGAGSNLAPMHGAEGWRQADDGRRWEDAASGLQPPPQEQQQQQQTWDPRQRSYDRAAPNDARCYSQSPPPPQQRFDEGATWQQQNAERRDGSSSYSRPLQPHRSTTIIQPPPGLPQYHNHSAYDSSRPLTIPPTERYAATSVQPQPDGASWDAACMPQGGGYASQHNHPAQSPAPLHKLDYAHAEEAYASHGYATSAHMDHLLPDARPGPAAMVGPLQAVGACESDPLRPRHIEYSPPRRQQLQPGRVLLEALRAGATAKHLPPQQHGHQDSAEAAEEWGTYDSQNDKQQYTAAVETYDYGSGHVTQYAAARDEYGGGNPGRQYSTPADAYENGSGGSQYTAPRDAYHGDSSTQQYAAAQGGKPQAPLCATGSAGDGQRQRIRAGLFGIAMSGLKRQQT